MQQNSRRILPIIVILALAGVGAAYYVARSSSDATSYTLSGTIEITETRVATQLGGRIKQVYVEEGTSVQKGQRLLDIYSDVSRANEAINSPIDGVVLERLIEPEEIAATGSTVLVVGKLDAPTLKVYVPENRYGQISLGQTFPVTVDSFPGEVFSGTVVNVSDQAEFTPRNVQTVDSRQTTVYAVKLDLLQVGDKLKPGMPADVHLQSEP
ncbi:MAG TPA: efflux RND transporter periplasmic adaptor subunit [Aggregatilineales bacterium]|nr:efflux RND transporter periplasmic adaptor subunit [Aggregatilineales bacterium]